MALWVGTYAAKGGKGLYPIDIGSAGLVVGRPEPNIANASYGVWCSRNRIAYFVDEQEVGRVAAWRFEDGHWLEIGASGSGGSLPCYLSLSPDRRHLAVANYGDGAVALVRLDPETGQIRELGDIARQSGRGPDPARQAGPHAHCALFSEDGNLLYHVDLGLDRVFAYEIEDGKLGPAQLAFAAPAGSGARHLLLHPDREHALLVCELSAELFLLKRHGLGFTCAHRVSTAPQPNAPNNLGGHLGFSSDGTIVITNRGHDSIVAFALQDGTLVRRGWAHTGGASPRHVHVETGSVLVAHEESGSVALLPMPGAGDGDVSIAPVPGAAFIIDVPS